MALLQLDTAHSHIPDLTNERQHPAPLKYATGSALLQASFVLELALVTSSCNNTIGTVSIGDTFCRFSKHFFASSIGSWKHHYQYHFLCDTTTTGTTETNCLPLPGIMSFRLTSNCQQEHNQSNRTIGTRVTYHAYCYGCNDEHTSILPTVPVPNDYWETELIQLFWKSTNNHNCTPDWLCNPTVKISPLILIVLRVYVLHLENFFHKVGEDFGCLQISSGDPW